LRRGQLLSPAGDNARDYLERARTLDPGNAQAAALRAELATALITAARLVAASNVVAAGTIAAEASRQGAAPGELAALELELTAARDNAAQRQRVTDVATARELIRQGALFAPPGSNALALLSRIQSEAATTDGLAAAWTEFRAATSAVIDAAGKNGESATFEAGLAALRAAPEGAALAEQLASDDAARELQERFLRETIPASELRLVSAPPATYPAEAQAEGLEGWVDVEFVVARSGQTRDGRVIESRPSSRFDAAALAALAAYRYAPFEQDGRTYERRVRLRIRFVLQ
jgi:TonB family protein